MRILMLGWEYPPHITGGLGTACEGLSSALAKTGVDIHFVVPYLSGAEKAPHMILTDSSGKNAGIEEGDFFRAEDRQSRLRSAGNRPSEKGSVSGVKIPALLKPYWRPEEYASHRSKLVKQVIEAARGALSIKGDTGDSASSLAAHYGFDMFDEVQRYASKVVSQVESLDFDVIHAHDWMTVPAAIALSKLSGKPFVFHVHSLEYDRSGSNVNQEIFEIERQGVHEADLVIAVSYYTKSIIQQCFSVGDEKIAVVHNGVYDRRRRSFDRPAELKDKKVVLFLGRVTFQKGPDYFVEAAAKVVARVPNALFVLAGSGDMLDRLVHRTSELGISQHFMFPGFLRGIEVEQMYSAADLYVMPSVSEPFGIAPLEAIRYETPVIISKQSGVSEVLRHALKVDFWDIDKMADLMVNVLLYEELQQDMNSMAKQEIRTLRWDFSASKVLDCYRSLQF